MTDATPRRWLHRWDSTSRRRGKAPGKQRPRSRLYLEALEGRCLPSTVTNLNDSGLGSLRDAIANTPFGGTVDFQPGLSGRITLTTGELAIAKNLTIDGPGATVISVSGNGTSRVFEITTANTVSLSGLTITGGRVSGNGGGILNAGTLTLTRCTLSSNVLPGQSGLGGGIDNNHGTLTVADSTLSSNSTYNGDGGAIYSYQGIVVIRNSILSNNFAWGEGGGIDVLSGTVTVSGSTLSGNGTATGVGGGGGGIYNTGTLTVTGSIFSNNQGDVGGAIVNNSATLVLSDSTLVANGHGEGAAILNVFNTATATISGSTISGNSGNGTWGTVYNESGNLTIIDSTLSGNSDSQGEGGAIANTSGMATISNSTISGNSAGYAAGGIINAYNGTLRLKDTIVAGNRSGSGPDLVGPIASQGHNLIGNPSAGSGFDPTDLVGTFNNPLDPMLGPLQDNGGPTKTMALLPGSPAIDAGDNSGAPEWDQRGPGFPRIVNGIIDIGAFEVQSGVNPFTVTNTNDSGPGSLRQAILNADATSGNVFLIFDIPRSGFQTIRPESPLPAITVPVVLDGASQPGYAGQPLIVVDGSTAGAGADGLVFTAGNSTVRALTVDGFAGAGIHLEGAGGDLVTGCYIGTDALGTTAAGNGVGVFIDNISNNTVGGTTVGERDLISGNRQTGIRMAGSHNFVEGSYIGTDVHGLAALPNGTGVEVLAAGMANTIGGTSSPAGNLISGNDQAGLRIAGAANLVEGSYIGTNVNGGAALPNGTGVEVLAPGTDNIIGGPASAARNLIAGNTGDGLLIDLGASGNLVQGNRVGTDLGGTVAVPNGGNGITVAGANNTFGGTSTGAGNLISGNTLDGIAVSGSGNLIQANTIGTNTAGTGILPNATGLVVSGTNNTVGGTTSPARNVISGNRQVGLTVSGAGNLVEGNRIGTDAAGASALPNGTGLAVVSPAADNTIGGPDAGAGNLISGNTLDGLRIDLGADGTLVQGNFIGTNAGGTAALPNGSNGIDLNGSGTLVGGTATGDRNLIAGNALAGIALGGSNNQIQGNTIGTNAAQTAALPNRDGLDVSGTSNTVGGTSPPAGNLISGNRRAGLLISGAGTFVEGNQIGSNPAGTTALPNGTGVVVVAPAAANTIGGAQAGAGNLISGNSQDGILVDIGASGTVVQGNLIGTKAGGQAALPNGNNGLTVNGPRTTVGGSAPGAGNLISGNTLDGIVLASLDGLVQGNTIGTNAARTAAVPNRNGISITGPDSTIGGASAAARNVIAANRADGVALSAGATGSLLQGNVIARNSGNGVTIAAGAANNVLWGNAIGTTPAGRQAYPNGLNGVVVAGSDNTIGGTAPGTGNVISGNAFDGVELTGRGAVFNVVQGNFIGSDATGTQVLGNGTEGINLDGGAADNTIGGTAAGAGNVLAGNGGDGVGLADPGTTANLIQGNVIGTDASGTLALGNGANGVYFENNASGNTVGGTVAGAGNLIAFNTDDGVAVVVGTGNAIQENRIFSSGNLGIELINGGNNNQAFPTLTSVTSDGSTTTITGNLASAPDTTFTLEFFANDVCNPSGYGEGQTFLGSAAVTTDDAGAATFTVTLGVGVAAGQFVSATATDPGGNTSQFAACLEATSTTFPGLTAADTGGIFPVVLTESQPIPVPPAAQAVREPLSRVDWYFSTLGLDRSLVSRGVEDTSADAFAQLVPLATGRDMLGGPALSLPVDGLDAGQLVDLL